MKLTTYITNLSLTDSWKGTTKQFLSHFKEQLRLLDSLVPDIDKLPDNVRDTFLQRAVQQNHDLRQIHVLDSVCRSKLNQQEKSLLKSTITYFGKQLTSMTYTKIQNNHQERPSSHTKMIKMMFLNMALKKRILPMIIVQMNPSHIQFTNPPSILLHPKGPQQFLFLLKSGEDFLRLQRK